jgi:hypothetical protein
MNDSSKGCLDIFLRFYFDRSTFRSVRAIIRGRVLGSSVVPQHPSFHPAQFSVGPSRRLKYALLAAHGLALSACLISALPWPGKLLLSLALPAHLYFAVRHIGRHLVAIRYSEGAGWHLAEEQVIILPSTVLTPFAIWLHFKPPSARKKALLIVKDAMSDGEFRRLTVKLKISAT